MDFIEKLYRESYDKLYRVAFRLTGDGETARDLVQDVFMLALSHRDTVEAHPKPEAWLMVALKYQLQNERRRMSAQEVSLEELFQLPAPESETEIGELLPAALPKEDRQILLWRFQEKRDYDEIAQWLGISEAGCRSRVSRALQRCRKLLDGGSG